MFPSIILYADPYRPFWSVVVADVVFTERVLWISAWIIESSPSASFLFNYHLSYDESIVRVIHRCISAKLENYNKNMMNMNGVPTTQQSMNKSSMHLQMNRSWFAKPSL